MPGICLGRVTNRRSHSHVDFEGSSAGIEVVGPKSVSNIGAFMGRAVVKNRMRLIDPEAGKAVQGMGE